MAKKANKHQKAESTNKLVLSIEQIERILGYNFQPRNRFLVEDALTEAPAIAASEPKLVHHILAEMKGTAIARWRNRNYSTLTKNKNNSRLAFLGKAVLSMVLSNIWFPTGYPAAFGENMLCTVGAERYLANMYSRNELHRYVITARGDAPLAVVFALIGAVWIDSGSNVAVTGGVVKRLLQLNGW